VKSCAAKVYNRPYRSGHPKPMNSRPVPVPMSFSGHAPTRPPPTIATEGDNRSPSGLFVWVAIDKPVWEWDRIGIARVLIGLGIRHNRLGRRCHSMPTAVGNPLIRNRVQTVVDAGPEVSHIADARSSRAHVRHNRALPKLFRRE